MIPLAQPGPMTEDERFMFECCGYLIIEDVLTQTEIDEALAASKRIHADTTEVFSPLGNAYESEPALARLIEHPAVVPKVRGLYGDKFVMQSGWCARLVANGSIVGWHQDGSGSYGFEKVAYPLPLLQLRASFSLTDQSHEFMGNMMMIPGQPSQPLAHAAGQAQRGERLANPAQYPLQSRYHAALPQRRLALAHAQ